MAQDERRRDSRQEIQLEIQFASSAEHGTPVTLTGVTRNVSPGGVYFHTDKAGALRADAELSICIAIPKSQEDHGGPLALAGRARVRRIDEVAGPEKGDGAVWGVAVTFDERPSIRTESGFWVVDSD